MTILDSPTIDCVQQRMKRNLEDFIYSALSSSELVSVRMRLDDPNPDSPSSTATLNSLPDVNHEVRARINEKQLTSELK
ncbi:unnamed protein product [Lactuca virosa]|uniref:Uncharacterized protein n=1 Tax=Lactuca virosa TaxID=75947 RepID=A0AAU9PC54_9ASTR|nr:unnamed protein product [Lactuca virosa]